jgi:hypothetical protein
MPSGVVAPTLHNGVWLQHAAQIHEYIVCIPDQASIKNLQMRSNTYEALVPARTLPRPVLRHRQSLRAIVLSLAAETTRSRYCSRCYVDAQCPAMPAEQLTSGHYYADFNSIRRLHMDAQWMQRKTAIVWELDATLTEIIYAPIKTFDSIRGDQNPKVNAKTYLRV